MTDPAPKYRLTTTAEGARRMEELQADGSYAPVKPLSLSDSPHDPLGPTFEEIRERMFDISSIPSDTWRVGAPEPGPLVRVAEQQEETNRALADANASLAGLADAYRNEADAARSDTRKALAAAWVAIGVTLAIGIVQIILQAVAE